MSIYRLFRPRSGGLNEQQVSVQGYYDTESIRLGRGLIQVPEKARSDKMGSTTVLL